MRCLIIGCGCRGRLLARALTDRGHTVRGTTRDPARLGEIERAGAEAVLADPDVVMTVMGALDHVSVALILLGSATGQPERVRALHETRLEMLLTKLVDTTVRGVVYEARGSVPGAVLAGGLERVQAFGERSRARVVRLEADPARPEQWLVAALEAVDEAIGGTGSAAIATAGSCRKGPTGSGRLPPKSDARRRRRYL